MFRPGHYISFPSVVQFPRIPREKTLGKTRTAYVNGYFLWVHLLTCMHACVCVCVFYCILSEMISRIECKYIPKIIHGSIQFTCVLACSVTSYVSSSLQSHVPWSASLLCPENLPVKNTGAGYPPGDLLHPGIQRSSPVSPALPVDSLWLSHHGSPF